MISPHHQLTRLIIAALASSLPLSVMLAETPPDLTKTIPTHLTADYLLGPTGMRGWISTTSGKITSQDMSLAYSTAHSRQIYITGIEPDSPADGIVKNGDVILGIDSNPFTQDPRVALGNAIDEAEKEENSGSLKLLIWRPSEPDKEGATNRPNGTTQTVTIPLVVMGSYSETAPFNCPKTDAIRKQTIEALEREDINGLLGLPALALLATGEKEPMQKAIEAIKRMGKTQYNTDDANIGNQNAWHYSYQCIALCEYYLLTKDESVLSVIHGINQTLAKGQSITGDWGHNMASYEFNHKQLHGRLEGYGSLNYVSLTCYLALVMGTRCGIDSPEIKRAIEKSTENFAYYIDKGAIPYGYHSPRDQLHSNNGMSGMAAIIFSLLDKPQGARFYAELCGASSHKIEIGHTGPYFSVLWTPLGANLGGHALTTEYLKKWRWLQTLTRKWDGGFVYQPPGGGNGNYRRLSTNAAHLMYLCLPKHNLVITGRDVDPSTWITPERAKDIAESPYINHARLTDDELIKKLGDALPPIRITAATELAKRDADTIPALRKLLHGTHHEQIGACYALRLMGNKAAPAVDDLMALVRDNTAGSWIRQSACTALSDTGSSAEPHAKELSQILLTHPVTDRRQAFETTLALAIVKLDENSAEDILGNEPRYEAARKLLDHPHDWARTYGMNLIRNLPIEDFDLFADQIVHVIKNDDPQYTSYANDKPRAAGLRILERLNIEEGIRLCIETLDTHMWGEKYRLPSRLEILGKYGANAKPYLPIIEKELGKKAAETIAKIQSSTEIRKLISIEDAVNTSHKH